MSEIDKALIVGPEKFAQWFSQFYTISHVPTVTDVWKGLRDGTVDPNHELVIIYPDNVGAPNDVYTMIASFASEACVCIFADNPSKESAIRSGVDDKFTSEGYAQSPIHFFNRSQAKATVDHSYDTWRAWADEREQVETLQSETSREFLYTKRKESLIYTVTSTKGGSGKTTTALLLAYQIAMSTRRAGNEKRVCVVDFDVFSSQLGLAIGAVDPTVYDIVKNSTGSDAEDFSLENLNRVKVSKPLRDGQGNIDGSTVDYFLAPKIPTMAYAVPDAFYYKLVIALSQHYDFIILDTSNEYVNDPRVRKVAYALADAIIFVTTLDHRSVLGMKKWFKQVCSPPEVGGFGISRKKVGIVINRGVKDIAKHVNEVREAADPNWDGSREGAVNIVGVIPDAPTSLFLAATNTFSTERLLFDVKFRIGQSVYQMARRIVPSSVNLAHLVPFVKPGEQPRQRVVERVETPTSEGQESDSGGKPGFFARLFKKKE